MQAVYALGFWYGGGLVASGEMNLKDMLKVFFAILLAAMGIAQVSNSQLIIYTQEQQYGRAKSAACEGIIFLAEMDKYII